LPPPATAEPPPHCPSTRIEVGLGTSEAQWCSSPSSGPPPPLWITDPGPPPPAAAGRRGRATPGRHGLSRGRESTPCASLALFPLLRAAAVPPGRGPVSSDERRPPSPVSQRGGGRGLAFLPRTPSTLLYSLKKPHPFRAFCT